jgi:hypothetical protein
VALELQIVKATIRWQEFVGAEGYAIVKDGVQVGTRGSRARTADINVDAATVIEVRALPSQELVGKLDLTQVEA